MSLPEVIQRGRELRKEGYKLIWHGVFADSVKIPDGEHFDEAKLNVRYSMVENKGELKKAKEYLILCETRLKKTNPLQRGYELN